jgi:hypothetical protein
VPQKPVLMQNSEPASVVLEVQNHQDKYQVLRKQSGIGGIE